jgi:hypothetical protein
MQEQQSIFGSRNGNAALLEKEAMQLCQQKQQCSFVSRRAMQLCKSRNSNSSAVLGSS